MRIDQEMLNELASLPDKKLWARVTEIAKSHGFNLPKSTPSHQELEKLREIARGPKLTLGDAVRLVNEYKRRGGI